MSSILNMEQVALSALPTQLFLRDGQTYYIQDNENISLSSCLNGDIVQQALDGLNTSTISDAQWDVNKQKSTIDQNYFVLNKDRIEEDEGVVQLSISEDFPIHLLNPSKNGETIQQIDQQTCLVENVLCSDSEKTENAISFDNLSSLLQLSPSNGSNELYDVTSNLKGNVTYAYQLTNGTKFNQLIQNARLTMPINSTNGVSNVQNPIKKTVDHVQTPDKVNGNGKKIVLLRGVNIKPKILLKLKNKGAQDAAKNLQKVRIVPTNPVSLKNQRNIAPQKMALPPLNRPKPKEVMYSNQAIRPQNQEYKSKPPPASSLALSNFLKLKAVTNPNSTSTVKGVNSSSVITAAFPKSELAIPSEEEGAPISDSSLFLEIPKNEPQAGERLSESELKKIATAFQNGELNIDKLNNSATLYDTESKTKIICRIVYPEELVEDKEKTVENNVKKKMRGRPSFRASLKKNPPEVVKKVKEPENLARTRSGRLSRPPRYMLKDFKKLRMENSDISCSENEDEGVDENNENTPTIYKEGLVRRRSIKSKCPTCEKSYPGKKMLVHLSKYPDHGDVNTVLFTLVDSAQKPKPAPFKSGWKKFLHNHRSKLDSTSLKELMSSYSDEVFLSAVQERFSKTMSPWNYLIERQPAGEGAVKGLLTDLSDIMNSIPSNMLQKVEPTEPNAIHISDERLCSLLNIAPGSYLPNDSVIKPEKIVKPEAPTPNLDTTPMETESLPPNKEQEMTDERLCSLLNIAPENYLPNDSTISAGVESDKLETTLKVSTPMETDPIDSVKLEEGVKRELNVSSSLDLDKKEPPELTDLLEKSPLETVDEILNERLNDLIPLDDVSSLVEGSSLDRSLFSTNSLELHSVSESTEDLLKTLENLTPELPPVSVPTDFDFTVLSSDFGNER